MSDKKKLTTAFGIPVGDDQNSMTAGDRGPILMQDAHLMEKLAAMSQEDRAKATANELRK